jgi:soluble lytic murein transglycosylase
LPELVLPLRLPRRDPTLRLGPCLFGCLLVLASCTRSPEVPANGQGGAAGMSAEQVRAHAGALLEQGRPWRATELLREHLRRSDRPPLQDLVLAARAEAGWGAWPEVHALLEGIGGLEAHENGIGLYLLGRARDAMGDAHGAVAAYRSFLSLSPPPGELQAERDAARLRLGLALIRSGDARASQAELERSRQPLGAAAVWLRVLQGEALAAAGDTAAVRVAVAEYDTGILGLHGWRARIEAARQAGDLAGARALANRARNWASTDITRAEFMVAAARAALDMGDTNAGRAALRAATDLAAGSQYGRQAADLLARGTLSPADHLAIARVARAQGLNEEAADGFARWLASGAGSPAERADVHLEHATALFYAERYDEVEAALRPIASQARARFLHARAESHRGRAAEAAGLYLAMARDFAGTENGAQALFLAASTWHDEGQLEPARDLYQQVISRYPGRSQTGLALMRLAGIAFMLQEYARAAALWEQYRAGYPQGTLWLQSTYWAGRALAQAGDSAGAAARFRAVRDKDRESYYALLASRHLGVAFWPLPGPPAPPESPEAGRRVAEWMRGVDLLRSAGFAELASAEADRLVDQAVAIGDRDLLYALAEALAERGYSRRAIRIGLVLKGSQPADPRLLRILYPFPYRNMITHEARDQNLDPMVVAALIRQESMFEAGITSPAGARGLMQIMPATGHKLAEAAGIGRWHAEMLYEPELNVHLGTRYLAQHLDRYAGSLPSAFSAYNAGAHRVTAWNRYRENGNDELFTERIPFRETRDYVKILTRNLEIYRGLYGN